MKEGGREFQILIAEGKKDLEKEKVRQKIRDRLKGGRSG